MQRQAGNMTRFVCLVAVLLVGSAWPCLADENADAAPAAPPSKRTKLPKPRTLKQSPDAAEALYVAEIAQKFAALAESANKLATGAAKQVSELRARAETAVNATKKTAANAKTTAEDQKDSVATRDAQMAAEVAQEMYGNATANPLLIEERTKWFQERFGEAKKLEATLAESIKVLEESKSKGETPQFIGDVLSSARSILQLAQNAENDAKYVARKRLYTEMLAERVEVMQNLPSNAKTGAEKPCNKKRHLHNAIKILHHRQAAVKAYLHAFSAQKIAVKCGSLIGKNATQVDKMYYEVKRLLSKMQEADYKTVRVYHNITNEAHENADESRRSAASTSENAVLYTQEAKSAADSITSCANEKEAKWYARMAHKASKNALNEMYFAMYQLFSVTVSLQQVTDAKLAVENKTKNAETDNSITDPKDRAIDNEEKAETSYAHIKADADEATDELHRAQEISKQMRHLAAHHGSKIATAKIEEQLHDVKAAVHAAVASSKKAQKAASTVRAHYEDAKAAADSALRAFAKADVEKFERAAAKAAIATQESQKINGHKVKAALDEVLHHKKHALDAYEEARHVVAEVKQKMQHATK